MFINDNTGLRSYSDNDYVDDFAIEFAPGYDASSLYYTAGESIPVIISADKAAALGVGLGDNAYIQYNLPTYDWLGFVTGNWRRMNVIIIGIHNSGIRAPSLREAVIMPVRVLENSIGNNLGLITIRFTIDTEFNRNLAVIRDDIREITEHMTKIPGWGVWLKLMLDDEELHAVVGSLEQNLSLLNVLYPVVTALSVAIALGLSLLLMLQNAKKAAIMRVLGATRARAASILCFELLLLSISGLILSLIILAIYKLTDNYITCVLLAGLYFIGAFFGCTSGASLITHRSPLELLQVRE